jgi:hypothetical protein
MFITSQSLSSLFRTSKKEIEKNCKELLKKKIFFQYIKGRERDSVIIKIIERILSDKQIIGSRGRKKKWHDGWNEALKIFSNKNNSHSLIPKFYSARENIFFRLGGELIKVKDKMFEVKMLKIYRTWYFKKYFSKVDNIYEFGAGTGINLLLLSKIFPKKNLYGSDFVSSAVNLLKLIAIKTKINLTAFKFDMSLPNLRYKIIKNSAIYTSGSLEQLSGNISKFINYILLSKPSIVIHDEPEKYFYNINNLVDYLGNLFQSKRKYTDNLLSLLKEHEKNKKIKIIKISKSPFGSLMIEGYNLIVWKPYK